NRGPSLVGGRRPRRRLKRPLTQRVGRSQLEPRVATGEIAISKPKARNRPPKASLARFFKVETWLKQRSTHRRADPLRCHLDRARGQIDITYRSRASDSDGAKHRTIGINPAHTRGPFEAGIGEQFTGYKMPCFLRFHFPGYGRKNGCDRHTKYRYGPIH